VCINLKKLISYQLRAPLVVGGNPTTFLPLSPNFVLLNFSIEKKNNNQPNKQTNKTNNKQNQNITIITTTTTTQSKERTTKFYAQSGLINLANLHISVGQGKALF
jgi:hypothetical protein